jgi:hypothetical protein
MKQLVFKTLCVSASLFFLVSWKTESVSDSEKAITGYKTAVPFRGDFITTAEFLPTPANQRITGVGQATHLGNCTFVAMATVNFTPPPPFEVNGTAVFTAANGDQFFTTFTGISIPTGNGNARGEFSHTITGGTGRFSDASGSLTGIATVTAGSPTNTVVYEGTIEY